MWREDQGRNWKRGHLQAKEERGLRKEPTLLTPGLGLPASASVLGLSPQSVVFATGAPTKQQFLSSFQSSELPNATKST